MMKTVSRITLTLAKIQKKQRAILSSEYTASTPQIPKIKIAPCTLQGAIHKSDVSLVTSEGLQPSTH